MDEKGTEAAAATMVVANDLCEGWPSEPVFREDHAFAIYDKSGLEFLTEHL